MPEANAPDGLQLDEMQVVSDLHLGGSAGFQIFASGAELAWLADSVRQSNAKGLAALVINGDFVDFLAEEPPRAFDPDGAAAKLDRVLADPAFEPAFDAMARLVATPNRLLIVNLGNHDLELGLPWVRERLQRALCGGDAAARARLLLVNDGTGVLARVGKASVLCQHGNEIDAWNVTDHERLRRIVRDRQYGRPTDPWAPNAGSQLVIEVMNQVKASYPFVDLLKPETQAVVPILTALNPGLLKRMQDLGAIAAHKATDMARMSAGFLGAEGEEQPGAAAAAAALPAWRGAVGGASAQVLMDQAEQAFSAGVAPISLVRASQAEQLGLWEAAWDLLRGQPRHEVLREALEFLDKDRSFDPTAPDDTFRQFDARVAPEIDLLLTGHTHLMRSLPRQRGGGHYYNSGTWARLMKVAPELRRDKERFRQLFELLGRARMADLDASPGLVMRLNSVVAVWVDAQGATQAELRQVQAAGQAGFSAVPVAGSRFTRA
ncbi:MAG: metallophosphoesterase [Burkholderiaceae bacterium]|nr:metallophosphoesterase [Burkholderiaceae bacterium]